TRRHRGKKDSDMSEISRCSCYGRRKLRRSVVTPYGRDAAHYRVLFPQPAPAVTFFIVPRRDRHAGCPVAKSSASADSSDLEATMHEKQFSVEGVTPRFTARLEGETGRTVQITRD